MPLTSHVPLVVVDTETTGIDPRTSRVIEIGAVRIEDGRVSARFETFIDASVRVPHRITRLTGISQSDLVGAPVPEEAWARYLDFAGGAVRVAHNAHFDRRFIASELDRLGLPREQAPWLCTVLLSRRLLPGLPSKGLSSVARFLGLEIGTRHRALADAELTAEVLIRLRERADRLGRGRIDELLSLQRSRYTASGAVSEHVDALLKEVVPSLPDGPGVYRFLDARGRLLYVGKAVSLRRRVGSYFAGVEAKPSRIRELVTRTRRIETEETPSEIEALLLEVRLIRDLQPPYNRALKQAARRAWLRLSAVPEGRAVVSVHSAPAPGDGADWYGPLASPGEAATVAEILGAVHGFEVRRRPARTPYEKARRERVERAADALALAAADAEPASPEGLLAGDSAQVCGHVERAMSALSEAFRFEEAAVLRDWAEHLARAAETGLPLAAAIDARDIVHVRRADDGLVVVVSCGGRLPHVERVARAESVEHAVRTALRDARTDSDSEAARIVAQWAFRHRDDVVVVHRSGTEGMADFAARVGRALAGSEASG